MSEAQAFYESGKIYVVIDGQLLATGYGLSGKNRLDSIGDFDCGVPVDVPKRVYEALVTQSKEISAERRAAKRLAYDAARSLTDAQREAIRESLEIKFEREWF